MRPMSTIRVSTTASNYRGGEARAHGWTGNPLYTKGEYHYFASSQESPACVVEPGTPDDVGKIVRSFRSIRRPSPPSLRCTTLSDNQLNVIDTTKTPFAVSDRGLLVVPNQGQISDTIPWRFR